MSRHQTFSNFVTTVGTNGTISFPLRDAENAGISTLHIGPLYRRNSIRFFVKMPTLEEARRLPAPMKADRDSVTFEPVFLYIGGPVPPHCTAQFTRVMSGTQRGKMNKKALHLWSSLEETAIYPASTIQISTLRPAETLEFEGVSYWFNARPPRAGQRVRPNPFVYPLPSQPPPEVKGMYPINLMLLVKMKWLPKVGGKKKFHIVKGSPLDWNAPATPLNPEAPAPEIPQPARDT